MRRHLKIKTSFLLIAWLMIFLHSIIPHNHDNENFTGCHQPVHHCNYSFSLPVKSLNSLNQHSDNRVCHISSLLFNSPIDDNLILHFTKDILVDPVVTDGPVMSITDQSFLSDHYHGTTSFRAPPVA